MRKGLITITISLIALSITAQFTISDAEKYFEAEQYDSAIQVYDSLTLQFPDTLQLYFNRGLCFQKIQQYDKAIADFTRVLSTDSTNKEALYMKAMALEATGNKKAALWGFEKLYKLDADYNQVGKRIKMQHLAVYLSKYWYYMIAMGVLVIIFLATVISFKTSRRV